MITVRLISSGELVQVNRVHNKNTGEFLYYEDADGNIYSTNMIEPENKLYMDLYIHLYIDITKAMVMYDGPNLINHIDEINTLTDLAFDNLVKKLNS